MFATKFTGRTRHRIQRIGFINKQNVMVLQMEVEGFVPELIGGSVEGEVRRWWVDAKPEDMTISENISVDKENM